MEEIDDLYKFRPQLSNNNGALKHKSTNNRRSRNNGQSFQGHSDSDSSQSESSSHMPEYAKRLLRLIFFL